FTLARHGLDGKVAEINRAGVEISLRAAAGRAKVFASVGPTGIMLMMGEVSPEDVQAAFEVQCRALAEAGADAIVLETFSDPAEILLAVAAAQKTGLPVVACMTFDSGKDHDRTLMGTTTEGAGQRRTAAGVECVGSNCGQGIEGFVKIAARLKAATDRPIWIKANAGLPEIIDGRTVYSETPEGFAAATPSLIQAGANFIGGCCGTTPEFIRAVKKKVEEAAPRNVGRAGR
ncbi:MAG: homocysteine S-methyltransferase family protein, partial [Anaerolineae bacterium]|nr:homocysteine S-methyltransferase family protein [Anaerolineae bacterium]